ncbi:MAG: beta-galactosidase trimerization domain-containing protein [Candidatus Hydrogenedentes bacterium]|nr:beta-galactosidase trimerization domain-containing protein [Candidatus Hydrogenedentota bacterium]
MRFRQIHLDFHTSEHILGIGSAFDPVEFADTLSRAHVNSVTCFARCHHGYLYYNTQRFPERRHPHLTRNLLHEQIEACHRRGIRVPIYITVQWDRFTAEAHADWLIQSADGRIAGTPPYEPGFYRRLCLNSPYVDFLKAVTREVLETFPADGLFFDIVDAQDCSCTHCWRAMAGAHLNPDCEDERKAFGRGVLHRFQRDMTAFVRRFNNDCAIFYNAGHIGPRHRPIADTYTHFEIESLPSGGWGYMHFPLAARYARTLGLDCLGMTGKFHTSWGDFHSFKNRAALEFECFNMLALNAKCSIGDQLHPDGRICSTTYELIGRVYAAVSTKEPWCTGARPVTEIAVLTPEEFREAGQPEAALGAVRMLQEARHQFDVVDSEADFSAYSVLLLPDAIPVNDGLARKLHGYLKQGGAMIASHRSGLDPMGRRFACDAFGVEPVGEAPFSPDFLIPRRPLAQGLPEDAHVMYMRGLEVRPLPDTEVLADVAVPYFNRTFEHFCSHRHTPSSREVRYPGIVRRNRVIYFAHPVFTQYHANAPLWCKRLVLNALGLLLPDPLLRVEGPSTLLAAINAQPAQNRWVAHLLHYIPERRGRDFDVIEDVIPLYGVEVSVRAPQAVAEVRCVPDGQPLVFTQSESHVRFTVPEVAGHCMLSLQFK